ncbi:12350_t:CDS:2, partial [Gigaspora rosea]
ITRKIRERYLRAILRQNIAYFDKLGPGEVTTRITTDTHLIQEGIGEKAIIVIQYVARLLSAFVIAFYQGWKMTLVVICLIPVILITSGVLGRFSSVFLKRSLSHYSDAGTIAEEAISTIRTVVAFGSQKKLSTLYDAFLKKARKEGSKKSLLDGLFLGVTSMVNYFIYALAFWYGST